MIEDSVGMATINDAERGDSDSDDEDDESGSESDSSAKERPRHSRPATVERLRPLREQITQQISQRDKIMGQVSTALEKSNSTDLSSTFEKVAIIQMLQNQLQAEKAQSRQLLEAEQARSRQLEEDNRALRDKYESKVAELHDKVTEISTLKLELRLCRAGTQTPQVGNGTPAAFPWSSPIAHRGPPNFAGDHGEHQ
jgi:hypothetical protein